MSEFNEANWVEALTSVYEKSVVDPVYRELCLTNPRAAIEQVSEIELPKDVDIRFFGDRSKFIYSFLLPPVPVPDAPVQETVDEYIRWQTYCTDLTITHL